MAAIIKIDQVGLPAGVAGKSRSDGLLTGALVTVTATGGGAVETLVLRWIPDGDDNAVPSFLNPAPGIWTFAPTPGAPGTFELELDSDGDISIRTFRIRTANLGIMLPGLNETGDPAGSLQNKGAAVVDASMDNEDELSIPPALSALAPTAIPAPFAAGNYAAWYRILRDYGVQLDDRAAGRTPQGFQAIDSLSELPVDTGLTWLAASDEVELSALGDFWDVFFGGKRKRFESTLLVAIPPVAAEQWVSYDAAGAVLVLTTNPTAAQRASLLSQNVMVAVIVVDVPGPTLNVLMTDMRHGLAMSPTDKMQSQLGLGSLWAQGLQPGSFVLGDGSLDTHAQFDLTNGMCVNQDQAFAVNTGAPASDPQQLSPVLDVARWLYRSGPGTWRRSTGTPTFPTNGAAGGVIHNANGTSIVILSDGQYVLATYFGVKSLTGEPSTRDGDRLIAIVGQAVFSTATEARSAATRVLLDLDLAGLPNELVPICTIIIQKDSGFANAASARVVSTATGGAFIDHRQLARNGAVEGDGLEIFDPDTIVTAGGAVVVAGGNVVISP